MNFAPKTGPIVAELLSGFTALLLAYFDLHGFSFQELHNLQGLDVIVIILIIWLLGTFIDVLRNLLEHLWDCRWFVNEDLNWDFFFHGEQGKLNNLDNYFWTFYVLDADLAIAILLFLFLGRQLLYMTLGEAREFGWQIKVILSFVAALFAFDARSLRGEIKRLIRNEGPVESPS
jgi:hypothetical protein